VSLETLRERRSPSVELSLLVERLVVSLIGTFADVDV
jgi:hypothetical protein